jgi:hypothetical protein
MSGFSVPQLPQSGIQRVCPMPRADAVECLHRMFTKPQPNPPRKGRSDTSHPTKSEVYETIQRSEAPMSAAEVETRFASELDRVEQWRHEALERAGYDPEAAVVLAASHDVDLHQAVELLERGCSVELALQILL